MLNNSYIPFYNLSKSKGSAPILPPGEITKPAIFATHQMSLRDNSTNPHTPSQSSNSFRHNFQNAFVKIQQWNPTP